MGVLECHQLTSPNKMVESKTNELCVKNQVEFIGAIRVSRCRFCGNFFPAKPTSTHTYYKKAIRVSRCRFGGINISTANRQLHIYEKKIPPNLHLLTLIVKKQ